MTQFRAPVLAVSALSTVLLLGGCLGGSSGDSASSSTSTSGGSGSTTTDIAKVATKISGKVSLSGVVSSSKPGQRMKMMHSVPSGKPGSALYKASMKGLAGAVAAEQTFMPSMKAGDALKSALVFLYDSDHPEWLYPIAQATTNNLGEYTLGALANAADNANKYKDGDPIPGGNYTLLAYGVDPKTLKPTIALQSVVQQFSGEVAGNNLAAQPSTVAPSIISMLGVSKNSDGTQTWGDDSIKLSPNASIQMTFSMAVNRDSITDAISISPAVAGKWAISPDWLSATFYPNTGVSFEKGKTYTVTVTGADSTATDASPLRNVYGNSLEKTSTGTFSVAVDAVVDTQKPTAQLLSPALSELSSVDVTTPIRVSANEPMDINKMVLKAEPTLGAKPGVLFIGKKDGLYIYEFNFGVKLKLGTTYNGTVSGGKDLAGNEMNPLSFSFTTASATEGVATVATNATAEVKAAANSQAAVKDIFGKWVRAMNDRNLPQLQGLMAGDFEMAYNASRGVSSDDTNRDGVYDLTEFGVMMTKAFKMWDYCGTTLTGKLPGAINVVADSTADFEFKLSATNKLTTKECADVAPKESMFAVLQNVNGAWYMQRASEGVDTRATEVVKAGVLTLLDPVVKTTDTNNDGIIDRKTVPVLDIDDTKNHTFKWKEVPDATAYVMVIVNARDPSSGFAVILPNTITSVDIPKGLDALGDQIAEVSEAFGFTGKFEPGPGAELGWQVAALTKYTVDDVKNDRASNIPGDVLAMSDFSPFKLAGVYQELGVAANAGGKALLFSEIIDGYDAGAANEMTFTVNSPRLLTTASAKGMVRVSGNTNHEYPVNLVNGAGTVIVKLNQGANFIEVMDACFGPTDVCGAQADGKQMTLRKGFNVTTTGGIKPVVGLTHVYSVAGSDAPVEVTGDAYNFFNAPTATKMKLVGKVDKANLPLGVTADLLREVNVNVFNDKTKASSHQRAVLASDGTFTVEVDIFKGDNWIDASAGGCDTTGKCEWYSAHLGVHTDAGSVYVAPVTISAVADASTAAAAVVAKENWGNGGNWDASAVTGNTVVITGKLLYGTDPSGTNKASFDIGSDGGWKHDNLVVAADGSFSLKVDLFKGDNHINIRDVKENWFNLNIFTTGGKAVIRPEIATVNGVAFPAKPEVSTDSCKVAIVGTALAGDVNVNWNADVEELITTTQGVAPPPGPGGAFGPGYKHYNQQITVKTGDADVNGKGTFSVTLPVVGGASYKSAKNFIDISDANWNHMGFSVTTTGACAFVEPKVEVKGLKKPLEGSTEGTLLTPEANAGGGPGQLQYGRWDAPILTPTVAVFGTSNIAGRPIRAQVFVCGRNIKYETAASEVAFVDGPAAGLFGWAIKGIKVYPKMYTNINVETMPNQPGVQIGVNADNANALPAPPLSVSVSGATQTETNSGGFKDPCGNIPWNAGSALKTTITGSVSSTKTDKTGMGHYNAEGAFGDFAIAADGTFSFELSLWDGMNNININDSEWNSAQVQIMTNNGVLKPRYVTMDTPTLINGKVVGPTTITGKILGLPTGTTTKFVPKNVRANFGQCEGSTCVNAQYTNELNAPNGAKPLVLTGPDADGNYTFSFSAPFNSTGSPAHIDINSDGDNGAGQWAGHGMNVQMNDQFAPKSNYYKAQATAYDPAASQSMLEAAAKGKQ